MSSSKKTTSLLDDQERSFDLSRAPALFDEDIGSTAGGQARGSEAAAAPLAASIEVSTTAVPEGPEGPAVARMETAFTAASDQFFAGQAQADTGLIRLDQFRADPRFAGIDGRGVTVAVLDSGIDLNHSFFGADANGNGIADRIVYSYNFVGSNSSNASDDQDHGSNVASIIGSQNATYTGMAPGVNIIALKVLAYNGLGSAADITEALNWVVANRATYNIVAVNMSLGFPDNVNTPTSSPFASQFANLAANNTAVVVSSGNYYGHFGTQGVSTPSSDPNAWSVGAVWDRDVGSFNTSTGAIDYVTAPDHITSFSQRSATMTTILAPGGKITGASADGGTVTYSGTSQAAPHISGLVADMQQLSIQVSGHLLSVAQLEQTMTAGAVSIVDSDPQDKFDNVPNTGATFKRVDALGWGVQVLSLLFAGTGGVDTLSGTSAADTIRGNSGNDTLAGNGGDDQLFGDAGNDSIAGDAGNDRLNGAAGADSMTGGTGRDVFVYGTGYGVDSIIDFSHADGDTVDLTGLTVFSSFADFLSHASQIGLDTVFDFGGGDGLTMLNVGKSSLVESDFAIGALIDSVGNTNLASIGNTYSLYASGSHSGPQLRYQGAAVTSGQFGAGWTPLGAEAVPGGYIVAWKSVGSDLYTAWNVDSAGNFVSFAMGNVSGTSVALLQLEALLNQDLNGNGSIGGAPKVIEDRGSTDLVSTALNYYLYAAGTTTGPQLTFNGSPVVAGQFGEGWTPISVEHDGGGYLLAWKNVGVDQYSLWTLASDGSFTANLGVVSGGSWVLQSREALLQDDVNGDGLIGPVITRRETAGATDLARVADTYFVYAEGTTTGPQVAYAGAPVVEGQFGAGWTPIGAEATVGGYQLAWRNASDQYVVWNLDGSGNFVSYALDAATGTSPALYAIEIAFQQDLNADGAIGLPSDAIETDGSTDLVRVNRNYALYAAGTTTGPQLTFHGAPVVTGQFSGWAPASAEQIGDSYLLAWKYNSADQYSFWTVASDGSFMANLGVVSGSSWALQSREVLLQDDVNGDGVIGPVVTPLETAGATDLARVADTYFLYAHGTTTGPQLSLNGIAVTISQFGAWTPIGAEATAGGYLVAWKNFDAAAGYAIWDVDGSGGLLSNSTGVISGGSGALQSQEVAFHQDLNGDGTIGLLTSVIETDGSTDLARVADAYFLYAAGTTTGPQLTFNGAPVVAGQFSGWAPISAEHVGDGYLLAWKNVGATQYCLWDLAGDGSFTANLGVVSGSSWALQSREVLLQDDVNGDGVVGPVTTLLESAGATDLARVADTYFLYAEGTTTGPQLNFNGTLVTAGQFGAHWTPIGVEADGGGYRIAWKNVGLDEYAIWTVDGNGAQLSSPGGVVSGGNAVLQSQELDFQQDLNGDGTIGPSTVVIESFGSTDLVQSVDTYYLYADGTTIGPQLSFNGAPVVAGQFPGWTPIGAEADGSNYLVAWKNAGTGQYTVWNVSGDGSFQSSPVGTVSAPSMALRAEEAKFQQDLNGDGVVGASPRIIESVGNTDLVEVDGGYAFYLHGTTSGRQLTLNGEAVKWGQFGDWVPVAVEQDIGSSWYYVLAWKNGAADQYTFWSVRPEGGFREDVLGPMSGANRNVGGNEYTLKQDINGDGVIGVNWSNEAVQEVNHDEAPVLHSAADSEWLFH